MQTASQQRNIPSHFEPCAKMISVKNIPSNEKGGRAPGAPPPWIRAWFDRTHVLEVLLPRHARVLAEFLSHG